MNEATDKLGHRIEAALAAGNPAMAMVLWHVLAKTSDLESVINWFVRLSKGMQLAINTWSLTTDRATMEKMCEAAKAELIAEEKS
mgnify:CR=1 FL=1|jgi:hypothetical protein